MKLPIVSRKRHEKLYDRYKSVLKHNTLFAVRVRKAREVIDDYDNRKIGTGKMVAILRDLFLD